ncbi:GDSL-type esterase/lipase family protein [Mucilaginibacter agri]|uniref:Lipolytic protein G-D-S-L family n=1 Tax=Mucilaginibacter agri TaxID=2695265 RepID=A0A966DSI8_9SPHI|nr:GDSL-type esterase/lipase family protein [Mucilaginibacter agri]NCD69655.1 lipolytic protein G-D-S-L family [Mucilaginibacter agri]
MLNKRILTICCLCLTAAFLGFRLVGNNSYNIIFIGDSITEARMVPDASTQGPAAQAATYLTGTGKFKSIHFNNQGRSGFTTLDFLPTENNAYPKVVKAADEFYRDQSATLVFSIMLGTNDSAVKGTHGAPVSPENYKANLKSIADSLLSRYANCKIIINEPLWYSDSTQNGAVYLIEGRNRLLSYVPQIKALVKEYKSLLPGQVFLGDEKAYAYFSKNYLTDMHAEHGPIGTFYLHPNQKGSAALGEFWGKAIAKVLN